MSEGLQILGKRRQEAKFVSETAPPRFYLRTCPLGKHLLLSSLLALSTRELRGRRKRNPYCRAETRKKSENREKKKPPEIIG